MDRRPVFAIFEGGGARGVAHVGAVAAAEDLDFRFMGVAGASAGALVAALVAAGFHARQILDPANPAENIVRRYGETVPGLLDKTDWRRFNRLRRRASWLSRAILLGGVPLGALVSPRALWAARHIIAGRGRLSTETLRTFLDRVLRDQVVKVWRANGVADDPPARVTFAHLDFERFREFVPLKIVATDITTHELCVFSQATTPDVEVAQAVAASVAIPLVFKPVQLQRKGRVGDYVDGGLVSNLPVWIFANEKLAVERAFFRKPPIPVVGFTLRDPNPPRSRRDLIGFLADVGETALTGSQSIAQDFLQDLTVVPLPCTLDLLAFDASEADMLKAFEHGRAAAHQALRGRLILRPQLVREELARIHNRLRPVLKAHFGRRARGRWLLRESVIEKVGDDAFRVAYGHNMDSDADDRLPLDGRGPASPAAYKSRDMQLAHFGARWSPPERDYMTKYERALAHPKLRSIIAVPIFPSEAAWALDLAERPEPCGVFAIDSDLDLSTAFDDPDIFQLLATQSTLLYPLLTQEPTLGDAT
jgi:NTE family protein